MGKRQGWESGPSVWLGAHTGPAAVAPGVLTLELHSLHPSPEATALGEGLHWLGRGSRRKQRGGFRPQ